MSKSTFALMDITTTERIIIELLADGKVDKEIAPVVNMKPRTVKQYVDNMKQKVNANNRVKLISIAYQNKILDASR
jgi:DNA-binding NarL/FixJ family response regulator